MSFFALPSCEDDEVEDLPSMTGDLTIILPKYTARTTDQSDAYLEGSVSGILHPSDPEYKWICDDDLLFKDTIFSQDLKVEAPRALGKYELRLVITRDGYYGKTNYLEVNVIDPNYYGLSLTGIDRAVDSIVDTRDNRTYYVTSIGKLKWFSQNLAYSGENQEYGMNYEKNDALDQIVGRLYSWQEATQGQEGNGLGNGPQGLCPEGWSIPTSEDWEDLANTINNSADLEFGDMWDGLAAKLTVEAKMNNEKFWNYTPNLERTNDYLWSALPGGNSIESHARFQNISLYGFWWASFKMDEDLAACRYINNYENYVAPAYFDTEEYGASVRCVKKI